MVKTRRTRAMDLVIAAIAFLLMALCLLPLVNILSLSLSSPQAVINQKVFVWPVEFTLKSYLLVLEDASFVRSLWYTALITILYTAVAMALTVLCAYPLAQPKLKGKAFFNTLIILTMYFSAGIIPNYILMSDLGLIDNWLVLILPGCLSVFNVMIMKSFFYEIPESLRESAQLDGANHFVVLWKIYLPLSASALATLSLLYAVARWNGFSDALIYLSNPKLYPVQMKLFLVVNNLSPIDTHLEGTAADAIANESIQSATVIFATVPILCVYPWLQRYFISGVTLGAVKG